MSTAPSADREDRLDEILASYLRAAEAGRAPDLQALLADNPDLAPELEAFFVNERRIDRLASPLRSIHRAVAAPAQGQTIGNYAVLEEIAHGGMGVVYRARQLNLSRIVALKMLRVGPLADAAERHRFRVETEAFAQLDHRHIVPIFEVGEQDGRLYFTMRLMEGGALAQRLARGPFMPREAAHLLADVSDAVHYAHQRGFLHRDLKPANILLDAEGRPHVSDFGLAKRLAVVAEESVSEATQTGTILGTPSYMAPEQAGGAKGGATTASDVYSLGAILFELLTGRPPFRGPTPLATLMQARDQEPERPARLRPGIDRDIETICLKCLEKDARLRYGSAAELADDLRRYLNGQPILARPLGSTEAFTRWCRRRPLAAALAASFVVGFVLVTWQWWRAERHAQRADANALQADANATTAQANAERAETNAAEAQLNARKAESHAQAEKEARDRAEKHFVRAHDAVNKFSTTFSERDLLNVPGLQDVRKELLEDALRYYQEFLKEQAGNPQLERELAEALVRVARIRDACGSRTEALAAYVDARAAYEKFAVANPADRDLRRKLASTSMHIGMLRVLTAHTAQGMRDYGRAREQYAALLREDPNDAIAQSGQATTLGNVALRYMETGELAEARTALDEALKLREALCARQPNNADYRHALAGLYNLFGSLQERERRPPSETRLLYQKALALREELVQGYPHDPVFLRGLAEIHHNLGVVENHLNNPKAGKEHFLKAHEIHQRLVRDNPSVTQYRRDLAGSQLNLGLAHLHAGDAAKSLDWFEKARQLQEKLVEGNPKVPGYRRDLARSWFQIGVVAATLNRRAEAIGHYERSRDLLEVLVRDDPANLEYRGQLGQTLNNLGLNLAKTGKTDEGRQALRRAIEQGRFVLEHRTDKTTGRGGLANFVASLAEVERGAGNWEAALAATLEHRRLSKGNGDELFRAACDLARLAAAAPAGADRYARLAVETLREARDARLEDFANRVRTTKVLDVLRTRSDFQELLTGTSHS